MQPMIDGFWRTVYRLGYPCAQLIWQVTGRPGRGAAIAVWHEKRLLCVEESYRSGLGLPGGGLNRGETAHAAARRELFEEVGLDLAPAAFRHQGTIVLREGRRNIEDDIFEVLMTSPLPLRIDRREIVWAGFLDLDAIRARPLQAGFARYLDGLVEGPPHDPAALSRGPRRVVPAAQPSSCRWQDRPPPASS